MIETAHASKCGPCQTGTRCGPDRISAELLNEVHALDDAGTVVLKSFPRHYLLLLGNIVAYQENVNRIWFVLIGQT